MVVSDLPNKDILIVATAHTPKNIIYEAETNQHQRIDYVELSRHLNADWIDYGVLRHNGAARLIEDKARMDVRLAMHAKRLVHEKRYNFVFSWSERVGLPLTWILKHDVKHVVMMHHPMSRVKLRLMQLLNVAHHWDRIITISRAEAAGMQSALDLQDNLIEPLLTPVDTQFFKPSGRLIPVNQQDHVQSIGLSHRDYLTLLRAMRKLPDITCHLRVGSSWVDRRAGHEGEPIPDNVEIKPYVHPRVLRDCYEYSRFTIIPTRADTQWTAGCTSVQIAQAMGKPVIATDRPGLAEYLIDGDTGILVRAGDDQDLAEAIEYLWRNPEKAQAMGRYGREWLIANYSLEKWLSAITNIFGETLANGQAN